MADSNAGTTELGKKTSPVDAVRVVRPRPAKKSDHPQAQSALTALGERLRRARVVRDIPLSEMARRMGVQHGTLSRLERGAPGVAIETLALALWHMNLLDQLEQVCASGKDPEGDRLADLRMPARARGGRVRTGSDWSNLRNL